MNRHASIYYLPEGYSTDTTHLMGRQAAGEGFLRAAAQSNATQLNCHAPHMQAAQRFDEQLRQFGFQGKTTWTPLEQPAGLTGDGCLFLPGPNLTDSAWNRLPIGQRQYSLCGITHTTASHIAMSAITDLLVAPLRSWDALICTSTAVRDTVRVLIESQSLYLREKLGATRLELPQLPIIPLGVHCDDYIFSDEQRQHARSQLGIADDEVVILFVGRLAFHAKAHPQQMMTALGRIAEGKKIRLLLCGWYANDAIQNAFNDAAAMLCPTVVLQHVDGRQADQKRLAWASGDIFMSLADNIQETFGLTPIEAMAAGLPVIVSDWDGYKDTVRQGVEGFRIRTVTPPAGFGTDLAQRYDLGLDNYDMYCGLTSQLVALDHQELMDACEKLVASKSLRREMGAAGRARATQHFAWSVIYGRYQQLWEDLAERRRADPDVHPAVNTKRRPDRPDPFAAFASYPTHQLADSNTLRAIGDINQMRQHRELMLNRFGTLVQLSDDDCERIWQLLQTTEEMTVGQLLSHFDPARRSSIVRGLVWLAKMELLRIAH